MSGHSDGSKAVTGNGAWCQWAEARNTARPEQHRVSKKSLYVTSHCG